MKKLPRLDGKPYSVRIYLKKMKSEDLKAMTLWLKENISGKHRLINRARFLDNLELYLSDLNDAIMVRMCWPGIYAGSSQTKES